MYHWRGCRRGCCAICACVRIITGIVFGRRLVVSSVRCRKVFTAAHDLIDKRVWVDLINYATVYSVVCKSRESLRAEANGADAIL